MTSNWQEIDVPILGLSTQRDPKLGPVGRLLKCDNGWMDRDGEIRPRYGMKLLNTQIQESIGISGMGDNAAAPFDCTSVAKWGDSLVAAFRSNQFSAATRSLFEWSPGANLWTTKEMFSNGCTPALSRMEVKRIMEIASPDAVADNNGIVEECDIAIGGSFACVAYKLTISGASYISVKIVDVVTGAVLVDDININAGARPRVLATSASPVRFAVFYNTGANLDQVEMTTYVVTSSSEADRVATFSTLLSGTGTNGRSNYDVAMRPSGTDVIITWANWDGVAASYFPRWRSVNVSTGALSAIVTGTASAGTTAVGDDSRVSFANSESTDTLYVYMRGTTSGLKRTHITAATLAEASIVTLDAGATAASRNNAQVEAYYDSVNSRSFAALRSSSGALSVYNNATNTTSAVVGSVQSSMYGERVDPSGQLLPYFLVNSGGDDPTAYVCRFVRNSNTTLPVARVDLGSNGFAFSAGYEWPSSLVNHSTGLYAVVPVIGERAASGSLYNSRVSLYLVRLTDRTDYLSNAVPIADALALPGGMPSAYDRDDTRPLGAHPAARCTVITSATPGALVAGGTYKYRFVVTVAIGGRTYRSPPSLPVSITLGGAQTSTQITQVAQMSGVIAKAVRLEIYRTVNLGDTYYRVKDLVVLPWSSAGSYNDTATSDAQLITNELLYTTGNVLDNYPAPAAKHLASWGNRLFALSSEFPSRIYFSKTIVDGFGVGFNPALYLDAADAFGEFTALAATDRALIAFKANGIYAITGDGPDNTGQGAFQLQQIATGYGCTNDRSIVATPAGLMFQGANGINLLDRGFETKLAGGPIVEYTDATTIVGACVLPGRSMACWAASNGHVYVWDWEHGQWYRWITQATSCVGCCEFQGTLVVADSSGRVYQEVIGQAYDNTTTTVATAAISLDVTFAPIATAGIAGFERLREVQLLGQRDSDCTVTAIVRYDYQSADVQTLVANVSAASGLDKLIRVKINRQKASAFELNIKVTFPGALGAGYRLSALALEVAAKRSLNKRHGSAT